MPAEALATPEGLAAARRDDDLAFDAIDAAFAAYQAIGGNDPVVVNAVAFIVERRPKLVPFRRHVDEHIPDVFREALSVLQTTSSARLELLRRLSETVEDLPIARQLAGLQALLQYNDATNMYSSSKDAYLLHAALDPQMLGFAFHAEFLQSTYEPVLRALLPAETVAGHEVFEKSPQGKILANFKTALHAG